MFMLNALTVKFKCRKMKNVCKHPPPPPQKKLKAWCALPTDPSFRQKHHYGRHSCRHDKAVCFHTQRRRSERQRNSHHFLTIRGPSRHQSQVFPSMDSNKWINNPSSKNQRPTLLATKKKKHGLLVYTEENRDSRHQQRTSCCTWRRRVTFGTPATKTANTRRSHQIYWQSRKTAKLHNTSR